VKQLKQVRVTSRNKNMVCEKCGAKIGEKGERAWLVVSHSLVVKSRGKHYCEKCGEEIQYE
jgi:RNA polymerase-binding transcription factor DksA